MRKIILVSFLTLCCCLSYGQTKKFRHILITNDDGLQNFQERLTALAKAVNKVADRVSIIVSDVDRSGTSNYLGVGKIETVYEITCVGKSQEKGENITAYTILNYPADCVALGLSGFFGKDRPDLVLSGINSGSNIGPDWFGSGTVGAARMSAFLGVKAIAFSGFDSGNKISYTVIPNWIKEFISSDFIDNMGKNNYLTITFPTIPFDQIKGSKIAERKISSYILSPEEIVNYPKVHAIYKKEKEIYLKKIFGEEPNVKGNRTIWTPDKSNPKLKKLQQEYNELPSKDKLPILKDDEYYLKQGYIIITPMTINENDYSLMKKFEKKTDLIPKIYQDVNINK
ncbi:MAG TPA: 5'/3'-nucleotidase SurE [Victivallales bacterium]|nr:5'/3'-nucleotidase SurE [Victivallales bacterium]